MAQSTALTEQEKKDQVLLDENFNPQPEQDMEIAKVNFLTQQRMKQYLSDSAQSEPLGSGIVRAAKLEHKFINQPKILVTHNHENASPGKKAGIVFEGEDQVIFHGRLNKLDSAPNEESKGELQIKKLSDVKELDQKSQSCRHEVESLQSPSKPSNSCHFSKKRMNSIEEAVREIVRIKRPQGCSSFKVIIRSGDENSQRAVKRFGSWREGSHESGNFRQEDFGLNVQKSAEEILIQDSDSNSCVSDIQDRIRPESLRKSWNRYNMQDQPV